MDGSRFLVDAFSVDDLVQAGVVYACTWSLGGCLADEGERTKFDQSIREVIFFSNNAKSPKIDIRDVMHGMQVIFGKRSDCPLPKSLNGKFDALPPIEVV